MVTEPKVEEIVEENKTDELEESEATVEAVEGEKEEEGEVKGGKLAEGVSFKTQAELDEYVKVKVEPLAKTIANKSTATYQQQVNDLTKELKDTKLQLEDKKEDDGLDRLEKAQRDEWGETQDVGEFQQAVTTLLAQRRAFRKEKLDWQDGHEKATQSVREVNAFARALKLLLPEDEGEFVSTLEVLAAKLAAAETDKEADLIYELEEASLRAKADEEPKLKRRRPDTNLPTAPGGVDISKLSGQDLLKKGFKKEFKGGN